MSRVPIRVRLTLAFALAMTLVLASIGLFLYLRLRSGLDATVAQGLAARASDVGALVEQSDDGLSEARSLRGADDGFAQILRPDGQVVDSTAGLGGGPLLARADLERATAGSISLVRTVEGEHVRLLAEPVVAQDEVLVVVVGASLESRNEALEDLRNLLLIGGPVALLLASTAGYVLAAAALRPVERMGERAATISAASSGRRLPVPPARDEIARLGERLNEMLGRLERALDRERALVANASHELRTPLALLKTEIELALDEPDSAPVLAAALRSAGEETDRLAQLADDLLLLARADAGELSLRRAPLDVGDLLDSIAVRFRRRAGDAGRRIEVSAPPGLGVLADRRRMEQALVNLVENALRHGSGAVRLHAVEHPGEIALHVRDDGAGFPPEFLQHAFERFSRADAARPGAGLGLAIVAAVARAHGGVAVAKNRPGGGADVALTIAANATPGEALASRQASADSRSKPETP